ncbi:MAG: response regulator [Thermoanaerobaculia bacterium]|nr:MAG: response regulator [Thermoanaerobaculia bacterium]MBZ0103579.1 response regulator [Thermoanaerobaculia bacterium]
MPRVWVVEDNDANFELVEFLLGEAGWSIERARDGREFASLLSRPAPDLVLLDMHLPDVSGLDLIGRLRDVPRLRRVAVLALTAHAMRGDRERFLEAGCDGYISKPIDTATFVVALERMLRADTR